MFLFLPTFTSQKKVLKRGSKRRPNEDLKGVTFLRNAVENVLGTWKDPNTVSY